MGVTFERFSVAGFPHAEAAVYCDTCHAESVRRGAAGAGAAEYAQALARAAVAPGWTQMLEPIRSGGKRYNLARDLCPACSAVRAASQVA